MRTFEWIVAAISAFFVGALLIFFLYEGLWGEREEIALTASYAPAIVLSEGYQINVRIENLGGRTAAAVEVVGELRQDQTVLETGRFVLDYVPGHSHRGGTLRFRRDPASYDLEVAVVGFTVP